MKWIPLVLPLLIVSCARTTTPPPPGPTPVKPGHLLEVQFEGVSGEKPTSRMVQPASLSRPPGISRQGYTEIASGLNFEVMNVEALTDKVRQIRYVQATYLVTNNTGATIERLYLAPVDLDDDSDPTGNTIEPTIDDTPFRKVKLFDGTDAPGKAADLVVGPAVLYDFQALDYLEDLDAAPLLDPFDPTGFTPTVPAGLAAVHVEPYTYYFSHPLEDGNSLPVTLSISFPLDSTPANNPFSFSMMLAIGQNAQEFESLGDTLNFDRDFPGVYPDLTLNTSGAPVVTWSELSYHGPTHVQVSQWDGLGWNLLGFPLNNNPAADGLFPKIARDSSNQLVVAWEENEDIFVKQWDGTTWTSLGTALDEDPLQAAHWPDVVVGSGDFPVVAWTEQDAGGVEQVRVKRWDGTSWNLLGTSLNVDSTQMASQVALTLSSTGEPVVAWLETLPSADTQLFVKHWDGTTWNLLGSGAVNPTGTNTETLSITSNGSDQHTVAWSDQGLIQVAQWNGTTWTSLGGNLNLDPAQFAVWPAVGLKPGGLPVVVWTEYQPSLQVVAKTWNGTTWERYGDALNHNFDFAADGASLVTDASGRSFVAFHEASGCGCTPLVYVKAIP